MFSALPLKADIAEYGRHVRFVPKLRHRATHSITSSARTIDFVAVLPERLIRGKRRDFRVSEPLSCQPPATNQPGVRSCGRSAPSRLLGREHVTKSTDRL
jgi:hypothetical protein